MGEEKKKGHSVGLSKVIGLALVTLLIGMALGTYLGLAVIEPALQTLHFGDKGNTGDQNNNKNYNSDQNNNNNGGSQPPVNNNPSPSNPTGSYGGSGQFNVVVPSSDAPVSGQITADIFCLVEQNGDSIQISMTFTPTSASDSLQQHISTNKDVTFNFAGTASGSNFNANAQGSAGQATFNININGSIDQNSLTFTVSSASGSQLNISTTQTIVLYPK
jgi:hypothetical protein